ncbi:MAG: UDP-N-acetylmuramate dehydrogenase [Bacteroidales bacterium]|nr:UDP-N-acetylmuramate dehydrogenase [Bacteroidales bacterium]
MQNEIEVLQMTDMQHDLSLKEFNTFGIDARAALFARPENLEQLTLLLEEYDHRQLPFLIIGEGSNILFKSDFEGLVVNPGMKGIELMEDNGQQVLIRVGAGENWDNWVQHATEQGWFGLENLSLIPGSVGSAPIQNIGAYGVEMKDRFAWLDAWDLQQKQSVRLQKEECSFRYRSSIFKTEARGRYIITHVAFRLNRAPDLKLGYGPVKEAFSLAGGSTPLDLRNVIISIRNQKLPDPDTHGNAGSFFKNPLVDMTIFKCIRVDYPDIPNYPDSENRAKIPAAWLIEKAGWKGKRMGNVGTWPSQPLVIVNYGGATGQEIFDFSEQIRNDVDRKFSVYLEREVNVV